MGLMIPAGADAAPDDGQVTFTKDVAPIFQRSCQVCHRPGMMAPMSLLTYEEARPWASAIKRRVANREMPPWHIDRHIGIKKFKDDPSLTDQEIATIVKWVDGGTRQGNPAEMPPPRAFADADQWHIGTPDLIVSSPEHTVPAAGPDWFGEYLVPSGLTEDRYIRAVESKPYRGAHKVIHHALTYSIAGGDDSSGVSGNDTEQPPEFFLNEYAVGKNGDTYPEGTGKLLQAGTQIKFSFHFHSIGEQVNARAEVGFVFYPKGYVPKRIIYSNPLGGANGGAGGADLDIPAGASTVRHDGYTRFTKAARITAFQPHMHTRGKRQCLEFIYPDNTQEVVSCANFNWQWHLVYNYADEVAPIIPAGTILHVISWHDNSAAQRGNPDPKNWVGPGARTIDEMALAWINWHELSEEDYKRELEARTVNRTQK
jgi:hypothetical protein